MTSDRNSNMFKFGGGGAEGLISQKLFFFKTTIENPKFYNIFIDQPLKSNGGMWVFLFLTL